MQVWQSAGYIESVKNMYRNRIGRNGYIKANKTSSTLYVGGGNALANLT